MPVSGRRAILNDTQFHPEWRDTVCTSLPEETNITGSSSLHPITFPDMVEVLVMDVESVNFNGQVISSGVML